MTSNRFNGRPTGNCRPRPSVPSYTLADLEVCIEKERIMYTIDKTLFKLEVAVCLPLLLANNSELLEPLLTDKELSLIAECQPERFYQEDYRMIPLRILHLQHRRNTEKIHYVRHRDKLMEGFGSFFVASSKKCSMNITRSTSNREDPGVCRIIHMLCTKPRIRLRNLIKSKGAEISPGGLHFLQIIFQLRNLINERLNITPAALKIRDGELRYAWRRNEKAKADISILANKLELQKKQGYSLLDCREELILSQRSKLVRQKNNCKQAITEIVHESEHKMVAECKHCKPNLHELAQDVKEHNSKLSSLLQEDLRIEKELRAKRFKVEGQLAAWLDKYDQDITEKQAEWDEVKAGFEAEVDEMVILQEEYDIQEEEYEKLMAEKELDYQLELEEKMFIFICNRAARRIQRYWRAYRERKLARKKRHKGKKGKGSGGKRSGSGKTK